MRSSMAAVIRFLFLCAILLAFPAVVTAQCTSPFSVQRVWIRGAGGADKTAFAPAEAIQIAAQVESIYGGSGETSLAIKTSFYNDTKTANIPIGSSNWVWNSTAPSTQGNYTVTVSVLDRFCGAWVDGSASFAVKAGEGGSEGGGADATQSRIKELEQWIQNHPKDFDWNVHNELRHLYSTKNPPDLRKAMEHVNVILQHKPMDDYTLNILSGWQIDKDTSAARKNLEQLTKDYPDLRFLVAACFLKIGDLYKVECNLEDAKSSYLKVNTSDTSDMAEYYKLVEERLSTLSTSAVPQDDGSIAGSIAYSPSTQVVAAGLAGNGESAAVAAVQQCQYQRGADDCWAVVWFSRAVGAFARGSNGVYGPGWGRGDDVGVATDSANQRAIQACQKSGGQNCQVIFRKATSAVSCSGTGGALTQPTSNKIDEFIKWLSACVEERLPNDPGCVDAAREVAGVNINLSSAASCLIKAAEGPLELVKCLGPKVVNVWLTKFRPLPD